MPTLLEQSISSYDLLKHPFYVAWLDGSLPREAIQKYCGQYFQLVNTLPHQIQTLMRDTNVPSVHNMLAESYREEQGYDN